MADRSVNRSASGGAGQGQGQQAVVKVPLSPYETENKILAAPWRQGFEARLQKKGLESCPFGDYPGKSLRRAWQEGWKAAQEETSKRERAALAEAQAIQAVKATPTVANGVMKPVIAGTFWPEGMAVPTHYEPPRRAYLPCPSCKLINRPDVGQAVVTVAVEPPAKPGEGGLARLRCRCCGHKFTLPVKR